MVPSDSASLACAEAFPHDTHHTVDPRTAKSCLANYFRMDDTQRSDVNAVYVESMRGPRSSWRREFVRELNHAGFGPPLAPHTVYLATPLARHTVHLTLRFLDEYLARTDKADAVALREVALASLHVAAKIVEQAPPHVVRARCRTACRHTC